MTITPVPNTGNSSKFKAVTKRGEFIVALSYTLRSSIWKLPDAETEQSVATSLAEAIVSRHDPSIPFKKVYIFAEHNSEPSPEKAIQQIRKYGYDRTVV